MHICINNLIIIGSDYGLSPGRRQAIIWTNAGILLTEQLGINFWEILIDLKQIFNQEDAFEKVFCKMAAILSRPKCVKIVSSGIFCLVAHKIFLIWNIVCQIILIWNIIM